MNRLILTFGLSAMLLAAGLASPVAKASPVQVFECHVFTIVPPAPDTDLDLKYVFRRHWEHADPEENFESEAWSQGRFNDNGFLEIEIFPLEGDSVTEPATAFRTFILDGKVDVHDEILDEATETNQEHEYEEQTVEAFELQLTDLEGAVLESHLDYPDEFDLDDWDQEECIVYWKAERLLPCGPPGVFCDRGWHRGRIVSVTLEDHDEDHGEPFAINAGINDAWVSADAPYQGIFLTYFPNFGLIFLAWFTYDSEVPAEMPPAVFGAGDTRWVTAIGEVIGNGASLKAELTTGGRFNTSDPVPTQDLEYGTIDVEFSSCSEGKVTFDFPGAGESGMFTINRVLDSNVGLCEMLNES